MFMPLAKEQECHESRKPSFIPRSGAEARLLAKCILSDFYEMSRCCNYVPRHGLDDKHDARLDEMAENEEAYILQQFF